MPWQKNLMTVEQSTSTLFRRLPVQLQLLRSSRSSLTGSNFMWEEHQYTTVVYIFFNCEGNQYVKFLGSGGLVVIIAFKYLAVACKINNV